MEKKLTVFYDNCCSHCTIFSKVIKKLDWLNQFSFKELRNEKHINEYSDINLGKAKKQMASFAKEWNYGFKSIYLIVIRIPLLFPFIPLLFLLNVSGFGQYLYMQLAVNRKIIPLHCDTETCGIDF